MNIIYCCLGYYKQLHSMKGVIDYIQIAELISF